MVPGPEEPEYKFDHHNREEVELETGPGCKHPHFELLVRHIDHISDSDVLADIPNDIPVDTPVDMVQLNKHGPCAFGLVPQLVLPSELLQPLGLGQPPLHMVWRPNRPNMQRQRLPQQAPAQRRPRWPCKRHTPPCQPKRSRRTKTASSWASSWCPQPLLQAKNSSHGAVASFRYWIMLSSLEYLWFDGDRDEKCDESCKTSETWQHQTWELTAKWKTSTSRHILYFKML